MQSRDRPFHSRDHPLSRTDVECRWKKRKPNQLLSNQVVCQLFPLPKSYYAWSRKPTHVNRAALYEDLKKAPSLLKSAYY